MSSENQSSIGSNIVSYVAFPALFSSKHIKNAVKYHKNGDLETFKKLNIALKEQGLDSFQRNDILLKKYEELAAAQKVSFKDKFFNIFRKKANKRKPDAEKIEQIKNSMKGTENVEKLAKMAGANGFAKNFKTAFSKGLKDKFGIGMTVLFAIPEFMEKVAPKFKEGHIGEGIKETGKWIVKTGFDFLSFVAGNAIGTVVGGLLIPIPGIGSAIGSTFVGMLGISAANKISGKIVEKVVGQYDVDKEAKKAEELNIEA